MATVGDLINAYKEAGRKIRYLRCDKNSVQRFLAEVVDIKSGKSEVYRFGYGYSEHLYLSNEQLPLGGSYLFVMKIDLRQ